MSQTKTFRGRSVEELLPQIRAELGEDAVIVRRREGVVGGFGGFFGKRCVEVEARGDTPSRTVPAVPARRAFDAYDAGAPVDEQDLENPVIQRLVDQASPFAEELRAAEAAFSGLPTTVEPVLQPAPLPEPEPLAPAFPVEAPVEPSAASARSAAPLGDEWEPVRAQLLELGLPEALVSTVLRDAERTLRPFDHVSPPEALARAALARHIRTEHGWRTKRRTIALVGAPGSGKTLTAAKLCHAFAVGSRLAVRTLSLEPASSAYRLGALTEHLDIGLRVAETPEAAARASARMAGESLIVVDTPAVSARDREGIAELGRLLHEVKPDEVHLVLPASTDARAAKVLYDALSAEISINRILVTRLDEVDSAAVPVGFAATLKKPISYVSEGRRPSAGLRPADPAELARLVLA